MGFKMKQHDAASNAFSNTLSVIAALISLGTLWFVARQQSDSHNQLLLSMKPSVDFYTELDTDDLPVGIRIDNSGPGPATIKSTTYYVDHKPVGDVGDATAKFPNTRINELEEGDTLGVGEHFWLLGYSKKPHAKTDEKELNDFVDFIDHHLGVEVESCPVLPGKCSIKCSTKGRCR